MLNKKSVFKKILFAIGFIFSFLLFLSAISISGDTFWHIRLGRDILETHTFVNSLTYTCPDFIWVNHSWLSDVGMYLLNSYVGFFALTFITALIGFTAVLVNFNTLDVFLRKHVGIKLNKSEFIFPFIILNLFIAFRYFLVRPLIISFLFTSFILNYLVRKDFKKLKIKDYLLMSIFFIVWANFHGGFLIGIGLIGVWFLITFSKELYNFYLSDKLNFSLSINYLKFLAIAVLVVNINPFGLNIWGEVFKGAFGTPLLDVINEWQVMNFHDIYFKIILVIVGLIVLLVIMNKRRDPTHLLLIFTFVYLSFSSNRHLLIASLIFTWILFVELAVFLHNKKTDYDPMLRVFKYVLYCIGCLMMVSIIIVLDLNNPYSSLNIHSFEVINTYPYRALSYIKDNKLLDRNFFNDYGWGGYLSLYEPSKKWFIDGRMCFWECSGKIEKTFMEDYLDIAFVRSGWKEVAVQYNIQGFLIKKNSSLSILLESDPQWKEVYVDDTAVVFIKAEI